MADNIINFMEFRQRKLNQRAVRPHNISRSRVNGGYEDHSDNPIDAMIKECTNKIETLTTQIQNHIQNENIDYLGLFKAILNGDEHCEFNFCIDKFVEDVQIPPFLRNKKELILTVNYQNFDWMNPDRYGVGIGLFWDKKMYDVYIPYHSIIRVY